MELGMEMDHPDYLSNHPYQSAWLLESNPSTSNSNSNSNSTSTSTSTSTSPITNPNSNGFYLAPSLNHHNHHHHHGQQVNRDDAGAGAGASSSSSSTIAFNPSQSASASPFLSNHSHHFQTQSQPQPLPLPHQLQDHDDSGSGGTVRPNPLRRSLVIDYCLDRGQSNKRRRIHQSHPQPRLPYDSNMTLGISPLHPDPTLHGVEDDLNVDVDVGGWLNDGQTEGSMEENHSYSQAHGQDQGQDHRNNEYNQYPRSLEDRIIDENAIKERDKQVESILDLGINLSPQDADSSSTFFPNEIQNHHSVSDVINPATSQVETSQTQNQVNGQEMEKEKERARKKKEKKKNDRSSTSNPEQASVSLDDHFGSHDNQSGNDLPNPHQEAAKEQTLGEWKGSFQGGEEEAYSDEPLYVNAKQYQRILARRAQRAEKEAQREEIWRRMWEEKIQSICDSQSLSSLKSKHRPSTKKNAKGKKKSSNQQDQEKEKDQDQEGLLQRYDLESISKALEIAKAEGWENWSPYKPVGKDPSKGKKGHGDTVVIEERMGEDGKPYLYESRHAHAMRRPRGKGGRFLTAQEIEEMKSKGGEGQAESSANP